MSTAAALAETVEELEFRSLSWPARARALVVETPEHFACASDLLRDIKTLRAEIDVACDPVIAAALTAHRAALAQKRTLEAPLVEAEGILKRALVAYTDAEARRRREAEQRAREEARRAEEEARIAEAVALEQQGEPELAQRVLELPSLAPPPTLPPPARAEGVTTRVTWRGEVVDLLALCAAVAAGTVPITAVQPNQTAINAAARAMREHFAWPGCRPVRETAVAAKAR